MEVFIGIIIVSLFIYLLSKISSDKKAEANKPNEEIQISEEEALKEYKASIRQNMERRKLVLDVLQGIGCVPEIDEEGSICFKYQGSEFTIDADDNYKAISIWLLWAAEFSLGELDIVKEAINDVSFKSYICCVWKIDEESSKVSIHLKTIILFISEIPDIENYLTSILNGFFSLYHNQFEKRMEELRMGKNKVGLN